MMSNSLLCSCQGIFYRTCAQQFTAYASANLLETVEIMGPNQCRHAFEEAAVWAFLWEPKGCHLEGMLKVFGNTFSGN